MFLVNTFKSLFLDIPKSLLKHKKILPFILCMTIYMHTICIFTGIGRISGDALSFRLPPNIIY